MPSSHADAKFLREACNESIDYVCQEIKKLNEKYKNWTPSVPSKETKE